MNYAWSVAKIELKHKWLGLLATFLMSVVLGFFVGGLMMLQLRSQLSFQLFDLMNGIDFFLIFALPFMGALFFSKEYLNLEVYMTNSAFLKQLQFYRMWSIPADIIAKSRMIYVLCCLAVSLSGFLIALTAVSGAAYSAQWGSRGYFAFIVVLIAYATAFSGFNPLFEFSKFRKMILIGQIIFFVASVGLLVLANQVLDQPLYQGVLTLGARNPLAVVLGSILIAGLGIFIFQHILRQRLIRKDFS